MQTVGKRRTAATTAARSEREPSPVYGGAPEDQFSFDGAGAGDEEEEDEEEEEAEKVEEVEDDEEDRETVVKRRHLTCLHALQLLDQRTPLLCVSGLHGCRPCDWTQGIGRYAAGPVDLGGRTF